MAYFAEINPENIVTQVILVESIEWVVENLGGTWIETKVDGSIRYNFAGIGCTYDPIDDAFILPYPSCGHSDIPLSAMKRWECAACEAKAKSISDPA